jgi:hypothetical protein
MGAVCDEAGDCPCMRGNFGGVCPLANLFRRGIGRLRLFRTSVYRLRRKTGQGTGLFGPCASEYDFGLTGRKNSTISD